MIETNQFIDDVNLTDRTSLFYLLTNDDRDDSEDNNEPDIRIRIRIRIILFRKHIMLII